MEKGPYLMENYRVSRGMAGGLRLTDQDVPILTQLNQHGKLQKVTIFPESMGDSTMKRDV